MTTESIASQIAVSPTLGRYTRFYVYLSDHLDPVEFRPVKGWYVAQRLRCRRHTVARALRALIAAGYIEQGPATGRGAALAYTYRLILAPKGEGLAPNRPRQQAS